MNAIIDQTFIDQPECEYINGLPVCPNNILVDFFSKQNTSELFNNVPTLFEGYMRRIGQLYAFCVAVTFVGCLFFMITKG